MQTAVEIEIINIAEDKIVVDVKSMDGVVISPSRSLLDVVEDKDYVFFGCIEPYKLERIPAFSQLGELADRLAETRREIGRLRGEMARTSDRERYEELNASDGPIRDRERKIKVLASGFDCVMKALTGFWPREFRDYLS